MRRKRFAKQCALHHLEVDPLQATILWVFAEAGKQFTDGLATADNCTVGDMNLGVLGVLGDQAIPIAFVKSIEMLIEHGLWSRLGLNFGKLQICGVDRRPERQYGKACNDSNVFHLHSSWGFTAMFKKRPTRHD